MLADDPDSEPAPFRYQGVVQPPRSVAQRRAAVHRARVLQARRDREAQRANPRSGTPVDPAASEESS